MNKDNKYQEALDNLLHCKHNSLTCEKCNHKARCTIEKDSAIIQELIDKYYKLEQENQVLMAISEKAIAQRDSQKEILDILKPRMIVNDITINFETLYECFNEEQYNKVKEWKEND